MLFSCLKLLSPLLVAALVLTGCGVENAWHTVSAVDEGGFEVSMPRPAGVQRSTIYLNTDPVSTHINILADSGITYVASWFDLSPALAELSPALIPDTIWSLLNTRKDAVRLDEPGPIENLGDDQRQAWFRFEDGTRVGVVMFFHEDRVMILNTGTPDQYFGDRERRNIVRFLSSLKLH